jgi:signal transduction histidine kinase
VRRRVLLLVVGVTTLVVLAFAVPIAVLTRTAVGQRADTAARDQARTAAAFVTASDPTVRQVRRYVRESVASTGRPMSIVLPGGPRVGSTPVDATPGGDRFRSGGDGRGFGGPPSEPRGPFGPGADVTLQPAPGGQVAFTAASTPRGVAFVRVYLSTAARFAGLGRWYALIIGGSLGLLALAVLAGELMTRRITRPLLRAADTARQLAGGDTSARAPVEGPREVAAVGAALNRLADRIDELIAEERETVADLSHRLRTPLTTLRLDAETLRDPAEADRIGGHVSDLERRLTAVIHAARRPQREGRLPSCDATAVVRERVAFWSALTEEQGRAGTLTVPDGPLPVRAAAEDLAAAVDALLENVVAHTPEGTNFAVRLTPGDGGGAELAVADDGPGLPTQAEVRGRSDRGRTGLGLDIARRCAEAGGGSMTVGAAPSGGALITLRFAAP